jgi:hypothetical protein
LLKLFYKESMEVHEVSKSLSASIVFDLYPTAAVGLVASLQEVRVTSQNSPQLLVSNKFDLADSIGSDLTPIKLLFACIAEVAEGLTAAFERRPDGFVRKFAKKLSVCLPNPP